MATSGVRTYQIDRNSIIDAAIGTLGVLAQGQSPTAADYTIAAKKLNMLIAKLRSKQLPLWTRTEYTITLTASVASYNIGPSQTLNTTFPLKLLEAYSIPSSGSARIPMTMVSSDQYNLLPTIAGSGQPIQINYQPFINYGTIRIWPTPDSTTASQYTIKIVYQAPFEYFNASTDTMAFPEEYYLPIVYELAALIAPDWGIPLEDRRLLKQEAKEYMDQVDSFGTEDASLYIFPRREWT